MLTRGANTTTPHLTERHLAVLTSPLTVSLQLILKG